MSQADTEKALRDFVNEGYNDGDVHYKEEDTIVEGFRDEIRLLPHQVKSRIWMAERETGKKTGGILADDMGLGKTVSTLTRVLEGRPSKKDKAAGYAGSTLVVCPVSLVSQWESEVKKYTAGLRVVQHHGPGRTSDPYDLERAHIVVTSYSVVTSEYGVYNRSMGKDESKNKGKGKKGNESDSDDSDSDSIRKRIKAAPKSGKAKDALFRVKWWRVVLDEAHNIKNKNTKSAIACCALDAKYRWCLTGTPMQNNVEEIYSLIKFLRISPLNDWTTFNSSIAKPIKQGRPVRALKRLQVVLQKIMLRRTKTTIVNGQPILELPDRLVKIVDCEFDEEERAFYMSVEQKVQTSLEQLQQGDINKAYTSVLVLLLRLRQACNHPCLISKDYKKDEEAVEPKSASQNENDDEESDELAGMLAGLAISRKPCQVCQTPLTASNTWKGDVCVDCQEVYKAAQRKLADPNSDLPPHSSKMRKIMEILREIEERGESEKTIIFSQFTSMLDLIEPFLRKERIKFVRYDGSMNKIQRDEALAKINGNASTRVILISFKAGSTGLNLTCCNNVILVDPWWNPALEDQAFDRAHRFGQKRAVNIHKLCVPNSVEERILELQEKKRALAAAALAGDKFKNMRLGIDDLVALFRTDGHEDDED
ncbi:SNF2 family N-terminal domain-containing protein [Trametes punicea]|nr:SNF2 family N-terminal domain-containing protein [Trametes punicea]